MKVVHTIKEVREIVKGWRKEGLSVGYRLAGWALVASGYPDRRKDILRLGQPLAEKTFCRIEDIER